MAGMSDDDKSKAWDCVGIYMANYFLPSGETFEYAMKEKSISTVKVLKSYALEIGIPEKEWDEGVNKAVDKHYGSKYDKAKADLQEAEEIASGFRQVMSNPDCKVTYNDHGKGEELNKKVKEELKKANEELRNIRPKIANKTKEVEKLKAEKKEAITVAEKERNLAQGWEKQVQMLTGRVAELERKSICLDKDCTDDKACGRSHEKKEENRSNCIYFLNGYCRLGSECTFKHDEGFRSKKWEEERKEEEGKGKGNGVGKGKKPKNATSFNQAKNARNNSQGGQAAGGNDTRNFGHPHGGSSGTGSMNYGPRPGLITQSSSGMQDPATSQNTAASHQLFTQPPPAIVPPFNRQVPGPYGGQGPYQHPQTPGANIGHVDTRGTNQGIPPSAAGWNNVSVATSCNSSITNANR